ncbi:hypothetical protein RchiOBHm_Chr4g0441281 [Rosa chinensis]|uniref:Uncharacterized protein n=1 Tax=Rosa chinensis TaxID=74649 RepID=A0A2P6R3A4_ROSCH|nr:hypothetical protein RchiOBHm_Chr4g0441281 [Rosa chinensis]
MSPKTKPFLPTLLLVMISIILINFPMATMSDNPCAYPCYPPPTGTTTTPTPVTTTPPQPTTPTTYPPPAYPTPTGYYPYNPPPSTYNGGGGYGYGPPPPDPILPYFPFYYKHGALGDASSATSCHLTRSTLMAIATATNLLVILMFLLSF